MHLSKYAFSLSNKHVLIVFITALRLHVVSDIRVPVNDNVLDLAHYYEPVFCQNSCQIKLINTRVEILTALCSDVQLYLGCYPIIYLIVVRLSKWIRKHSEREGRE